MQHFYAYISRLKLIQRWGLMRNTQPENDAEHSLQVAFIAHGLALIAKHKLNKDVDTEFVLALACYHDISEVITGDLPTPIKYKNRDLKNSYKAIEEGAQDRLLEMLNEPLKSEYAKYIKPDESTLEWKLVKAADRICAYIKCVEEEKAGNQEFINAKKTIYESIINMNLKEVEIFIEESLNSFSLSLDEISK